MSSAHTAGPTRALNERRARRPEAEAWPRMVRWWNAQGGRTKLALALAALFAMATVLNLTTASLRSPADRAVPTPAASAQLAPAPLVLTAESQPTDAAKTWTATKVWQGSASRETETFTVREHWRVDWIFSPVQSGAILQVFIYQSDGRLLLNLAANTQKAGADSSFWAGPGTYFLRVNSSGGDWKIAVQDLR